MSRTILTARAVAAAALILALLSAVAPGGGAAHAEEPVHDGYVCPPCGCSEDGKVSAEPGNCPACRMARIRQSELQRVAVLLFEGVQIIDYTAPWEVFGQAGFEVYSVSKSGQPLKTFMGMTVTPGHSFETAPVPTILLVPGGAGVRAVMQDEATMAWVRTTAGKARHVLSVCNGAFILAHAGLLEGGKATTFYPMLDALQAMSPGIQVLRDARWADNGKVITSAGLTSGMDAALHVVSKVRGMGAAQRLALNLEYDWNVEGGYARGALAETHMPRLTGSTWDGTELLSTAGDRDRWQNRYRLAAGGSPEEALARVKATLDNMRSWMPGDARDAGTAEARWKFVDDADHAWTGQARVQPDAGDAKRLVLDLSVARDAGPGTRAGAPGEP